MHSSSAAGGVVAAPIVTAVGGMMLVIAARQGGPSINVLDLPTLTTARLVWRDNLGENGAAIRMRSGSRTRA
jgi:hypothetical protein